jgi:CRISPR-associated protein Csm2
MRGFPHRGWWRSPQRREKAFAGAVKTAQIRKFHGHLVRFVIRVRTRHEDVAEVQLLKYHLAYAAGRDSKLKDFAAFFTAALDRVKSREDLERFKQLYDATLAYHKFEGGKE